ncbi:putative acetyltransferase [Paucidesulfovibrio gracilis DSM 16080]|jgi:putative acetyltransferase|uniref:Putative acetyltransferase n=1 Tax=Paucidesulfovibrio gracilis DSM 16080 TaxID=1121449 RepID=A0A1T4WTT2_9BACT|nr:N-acetyltransferase [Paucidesulfovibrio gracilis]SKA80021.1 putative acetyltransferase [Paucidesulfovibrio gracilis DSM 16080]
MQIRPERGTDRDIIHHVLYRAFKGHPQHPPGSEPMEPVIVDTLRRADALTLSLVAEQDGVVAGQVTFSPVWLGVEAQSGWFALGPVGVDPPLQNRGIGSALIREGLRIMRQRDALGVVLVGEPAYYKRFGFSRHDGLSLPCVPEQYVLGLAWGNAAPTGVIRHHAAFHVD